MRFDGIIKIDKSGQLPLPMLSANKHHGGMPHFQQRVNDTLDLIIGLRRPDSRKLLSRAVGLTARHKVMLRRAFIFRTIVGIGAFDGVRTFLDDLRQKPGRRLLRFVWLDGRIEFSVNHPWPRTDTPEGAQPLLADEQW